MAEGGCCTTAAALIGYKRPISWLRYKTKKVEPKVQSPAQCSYERLAALAASPSIKRRGHKPRAADGVRPWRDVAVVVYAPRRHGAGSRQGGGLAVAMVLEEMCDCLNLSGDALLLTEFWILPLAFFCQLSSFQVSSGRNSL